MKKLIVLLSIVLLGGCATLNTTCYNLQRSHQKWLSSNKMYHLQNRDSVTMNRATDCGLMNVAKGMHDKGYPYFVIEKHDSYMKIQLSKTTMVTGYGFTASGYHEKPVIDMSPGISLLQTQNPPEMKVLNSQEVYNEIMAKYSPSDPCDYRMPKKRCE